jgi:stage IV sporulation protein FB
MVEFKLFGIAIRVEPTFWLTLGLLGLMSSDPRSSEDLLWLALFILAGFISILIHEMGHALMIKRYKLPTQVVLSNFGGYATYPAGILNRMQSFLVTAAGPGIQILAATVIWFISPYIGLEGNMLNQFVGIFIYISLFWALLNCLPILPLDGGQMLGAIMGPKRKAGVHLTGVITATALGLLALYTGRIFGTLFMGMFAYQNYQAWKQTKS